MFRYLIASYPLLHEVAIRSDRSGETYFRLSRVALLGAVPGWNSKRNRHIRDLIGWIFLTSQPRSADRVEQSKVYPSEMWSELGRWVLSEVDRPSRDQGDADKDHGGLDFR